MTLVACIGGGQLGRMLGLAGLPLGLSLPLPRPLARRVRARRSASSSWRRTTTPAALDRLADGAAVVTYEFENVPVEAARARRAPCPARARSSRARTGCARRSSSARSGSRPHGSATLGETGLPALVKSRRLGYDGKGQRRVERRRARSADGELAEELVAFDRELSIVGVRARDGETRFWPVAENVHRDGILRVTRAPAADAPQAEAEAICTALMDALGYVGVLAVELFEVGGRLLANEFAPRVHNTAHWTIDGAETSQFENHLRAILGLPLGRDAALGAVVMVNLIGAVPPLDELLALPGAHVHLYGKEPRAGRKVGHVTLVDPDEETVERVDRARRTSVTQPRLPGVRSLARRRACGCARKYASRRCRSETCV